MTFIMLDVYTAGMEGLKWLWQMVANSGILVNYVHINWCKLMSIMWWELSYNRVVGEN